MYALSWRQLKVTLASCPQPIEKIAHLLGLEAVSIPETAEVDLIIEEESLHAKFIDKIVHCRDADSLIVNAVNLVSTCFLNRSKESVLHSGAIVVQGEAVLFSGLPHAGKSTLALSAWLEGDPIINDDLLLYDDARQCVSSFPKPSKPRLPSLKIPSAIRSRAGANNLAAGHFVHDIGLFIGRRAQGMLKYEEEIPVRSLFFIERGEKTEASPVPRMQALVLALSQAMPNGSCLKIGALINHLNKTGSIYRLCIGDHDQTRGLEIMRKLDRYT